MKQNIRALVRDQCLAMEAPQREEHPRERFCDIAAEGNRVASCRWSSGVSWSSSFGNKWRQLAFSHPSLHRPTSTGTASLSVRNRGMQTLPQRKEDHPSTGSSGSLDTPPADRSAGLEWKNLLIRSGAGGAASADVRLSMRRRAAFAATSIEL